MTYKPPVRDLVFALNEAADFGRLSSAFPGADADTVAAVLEAAGAFTTDVLAPAQPHGRHRGRALRERRGHRRAGLRRRLPGLRRRAAGTRSRADPALRRPGPAQGHGAGGLRDGPRRQHGLRPLPDADPGRHRGAGPARHRAAEAPGAAQAGLRRMDRRHEPDRAAGRLGPRRADHHAPSRTGTAATGSPARRSSSPGATTTPPTTSATWSWPALPDAPPGVKGISLFLAPKSLVNDDGSLGAAQRLPRRPPSSTSWASTARPPASCSTRARRPSWSASWARACRTCS